MQKRSGILNCKNRLFLLLMGFLLFPLNQEVFPYTPEKNLSAPRPSTPPVTPLSPSASQRVDEPEIETKYNEETNTPEDYTTNIFSETTEEEISSETGHTATPVTVAYSPDGSKLIMGQDYEDLSIWDLNSGQQISKIFGGISIGDVHINSGGTRAFAGGWDQFDYKSGIKVWEVSTGQESGKYQKESSHWVQSLSLTTDEKTLLWSCGPDLFVTNLSDHQETTLKAGDDEIISSQNGKEIIQFLNFDSSEWVALTPQGYYTASEKGAENLKISMEGMAFPVKSIEHLFNSPEIVQSALSGEEILISENASEIYTLINGRNNHSLFFMFGLFEFIFIVLIIFGFPFLIAIIDVLRSEFVNENKQIWLLVVVFLPLIEPVLYFFIGRKQKIRN